jgi:hypothetical protein
MVARLSRGAYQPTPVSPPGHIALVIDLIGE